MESSDLVEIVETRLRAANEYLIRGYELITAQTVKASALQGDGKTCYVKRPAGVKPFHPDHPPREGPSQHKGLGHHLH